MSWQSIAHELQKRTEAINAALDAYNKAFDKAGEARKEIPNDEFLDGFSDCWNEAEGAIMAIEESIKDLEPLTNFIWEKLT